MSSKPDDGRLGPWLLAALLAASLVAGIVVYHERTENLALEVPQLDRRLGEGPNAEIPARIQFFVRFDEPHARVEIVGKHDVLVRTFGADVTLASEERIECAWDGRDDAGRPVDPGAYRLRVYLPGEGRDMVFPQRIRVGRFEEASAGSGADGATVACVRADSGEPLE